MRKITDIELNTLSKVIDISAEPLIRERLLEFGLSPGRTVKVLRRLPLAGPIVVQAGSLFIALRLSEAEQVWVE